MSITINSAIKGFGAAISLLAFYFILMRLLSGSWYTTVDQFERLWYLMVPLSLGFGIQVGLYMHIRQRLKHVPSHVMTANTSVSTIGMVACCAHHLTDVLPLLGLTAVSTILVNYQTPILLVGILSNVIGIYYLLSKLRRFAHERR